MGDSNSTIENCRQMTRAEKLGLLESTIGTLSIPLTDEQLDFVLHPINSAVFLKACPGSGKTEVVGIKSAFEIAAWENAFSGIAILSFTKNAAGEIGKRIQTYGGASAALHPHFVGTIDSWIHGYLLQPFAHHIVKYQGNGGDKSIRLVDNESRYDFLTHFTTVLSTTPKYKDAWVNEYYLQCSEPMVIQSQSKSLVLEGLSPAIMEELEKNKKRFLKAGLATYADAEFLCYMELKKNPGILKNLSARFPVVMIDECQDLSTNQLAILGLLAGSGTVIHFIGDPNQSIYEFKKVRLQDIHAYIEKYQLTKMFLTRNFRSNQKIVNISAALKQIHDQTETEEISGHIKELHSSPCVIWEYDVKDFQQIPQRFINLVHEVNETILTDTKIEIKRSAVLARGHTTLAGFGAQLSSDLSKIQCFANALNCWMVAPRTGKDMNNALKLIGKSLCQLFYGGKGIYQQQHCPECYDPIAWRNQLFRLIENAVLPDQKLYPFDGQNWSVWTGNLKVFLKKNHLNLILPDGTWDKMKNTVKAPPKMATLTVTDLFKNINYNFSEQIRITTFHDVKGESLDAVIIVSSKDKKSRGGHFEHWISADVDEKEFVRFAYVASSRPRHLLVWAVPKLKDREPFKAVVKLGFIEL